MYIALNDNTEALSDDGKGACQIDINLSNSILRGYDIIVKRINVSGNIRLKIYNVNVSETFRFRWLQTTCYRFNCFNVEDESSKTECIEDVADEIWRLNNVFITFTGNDNLHMW